MTVRLDISIGPVQGFVAQSRRTRDLWCGSYLLSFLCAHAIHGAQQAGGKVTQPLVDDDPLVSWVAARGEGAPPIVGSVPNHFVVQAGDTQAAQRIAESAKQALDAAWRRVRDAVWKRFVSHASAYGHGTEAIWRHQTDGFWEIMWAVAPDNPENNFLARRKHWRSHRLPEEGGDKCSIMHDLQELSGYVRAQGTDSRKRQDAFWQCIGERLGALDLDSGRERLCAIALVKRLLPKVSEKTLGWHIDTSHWPSTVAIAARPWVREVLKQKSEAAREYAEAVKNYTGNNSGAFSDSPPPGLDPSAAGRFPRLDANYFHREFVQDARRCPLPESDSASDSTDEQRRKLDALLQAVYGGNADSEPGAPPTFYALLLADGDRLGNLLETLGGERVSEALATFTGKVGDIVEEHDGVVIYAGGDDVMAMLPVVGALPCAETLSACYRNCFDGGPADATLSAAVLCAQIRVPLQTVLQEAHRLLDAVAKDGNGRNSLAAAVFKPGGINSLWVTAWQRPDGGSATQSLNALTEFLAKDDCGYPGLSSSLIYRLREMLSLLGERPQWAPGTWIDLPADMDIQALLHAEILHSLAAQMGDGAQSRARELADSIYPLLQPARNKDAEQGAVAGEDAAQAGIDALLLARFLSHRGYDEAR